MSSSRGYGVGVETATIRWLSSRLVNPWHRFLKYAEANHAAPIWMYTFSSTGRQHERNGLLSSGPGAAALPEQAANPWFPDTN